MKLQVLMRHSRSSYAGCIPARQICRHPDTHHWALKSFGGTETDEPTPCVDVELVVESEFNKDKDKGEGRIQPRYKQPCFSILKDPQRHHLIRLLLKVLALSSSDSCII
jgi:hypothetical protein